MYRTGIGCKYESSFICLIYGMILLNEEEKVEGGEENTDIHNS
jgi:hypothetical protein